MSAMSIQKLNAPDKSWDGLGAGLSYNKLQVFLKHSGSEWIHKFCCSFVAI